MKRIWFEMQQIARDWRGLRQITGWSQLYPTSPAWVISIIISGFIFISAGFLNCYAMSRENHEQPPYCGVFQRSGYMNRAVTSQRLDFP